VDIPDHGAAGIIVFVIAICCWIAVFCSYKLWVQHKKRQEELVTQQNIQHPDCLYEIRYVASQREPSHRCLVCDGRYPAVSTVKDCIATHSYRERISVVNQKRREEADRIDLEEQNRQNDELSNDNRLRLEHAEAQYVSGAIDPATLPIHNPSIRVCQIYGTEISVYLCSVCFGIYLGQAAAVECASSHGHNTPLTASTYAVGLPMSAAMSPQVERTIMETINNEELDLIRGAERTVREQQSEFRQLMIIEDNNGCRDNQDTED